MVKIPAGLQIEPEVGAHAEVAGEAVGNIGCEVGFFSGELAELFGGGVGGLGEGFDGEVEGFEEFFAEHFAGMGWGLVSWNAKHSGCSLVLHD